MRMMCVKAGKIVFFNVSHFSNYTVFFNVQKSIMSFIYIKKVRKNCLKKWVLKILSFGS